MLEFEVPYAFYLLPLPLLIYWFMPEFKDQSEAVRVPFFHLLAEMSGEDPSKGSVVLLKNFWQKLNLLVAWSLIITALARPVLVEEPVSKEIIARDMLLIVDLSGSMDEQDFTADDGSNISRLEAVKLVVGEFIDRREGDRLGLAVFGDSAFPQSTFSEDHETIKTLLDELQPKMAGAKTMIGDAIGLAVRLFDASDKENKVAILLTDGNDSGSRMPVSKAVEIAASKGITIHTVAMGNPETTGEKALDLAILENIANGTDGEFFVALNKDELTNIYETLDRIEPELIDTISYRPKTDVFYAPIALLLLISAVFLFLLLRFRGPDHA